MAGPSASPFRDLRCEGKQTPKNNRELPHYPGRPHPPDLSLLSELFAPSVLRKGSEVGGGGDPPPRAARGKKDCECRIGGGRGGKRMASEASWKSGKKERGTTTLASP